MMRIHQNHVSPAIMLSVMVATTPSLSFAQDRINPNIAGGLVTPRIINPSALIAQPVKSRISLRPRDVRSDLRADPRARDADVPLTDTAVLSAFRLGFSNGDHHVREVTVLRTGTGARGVLADENGDDNYAFTASWWNVPGTTSGEIRGTADSRARYLGIDIPAGPSNSTLALAGFSLKMPKDNEIYSLSVNLEGGTRKAKFSLETTGAIFADVEYIIQYVWVPNAALNGDFTVTGAGLGENARRASSVSGALPSSDRYILRSFSLGYNDSNRSAQNLLELGVTLAPAVNPTVDREVVSWRDNDLNERINWRVDYSVLK
jgi:hypothetical protein